MAAVAAVFLLAGITLLAVLFGPPPIFIVGLPAVFTYSLWYVTYLREPLDPKIVLPSFVLSVAGFSIHAIEEYLGHYGPSIARIFGFPWTDTEFVVVVFALLGVLGVVSVGLFFRVRMAGLVAIAFLTTRLAEMALFIFPLLKPSVKPGEPGLVVETLQGVVVRDMPNYSLAVSGRYYFPGMLTFILTLAPAVVCLWRMWRYRPRVVAG